MCELIVGACVVGGGAGGGGGCGAKSWDRAGRVGVERA